MRTILLVASDWKDIDLFRAFLSRAFCRVLTASTIADAVDLASREPIDLIITTFIDPGLAGLTPGSHRVPVLLITAAAVDLATMGVSAVLPRPLSEESFLHTARQFIDLPALREPRVSTSLSCLGNIDRHDVPIRIIDISRGGALLKSVFPLPGEESRFTLGLELPLDGAKRHWNCQAVVVRRISETQIGIRFVDLLPEADAAICHHIDEVRQEAFDH